LKDVDPSVHKDVTEGRTDGRKGGRKEGQMDSSVTISLHNFVVEGITRATQSVAHPLKNLVQL
jgi:hypothetical protein